MSVRSWLQAAIIRVVRTTAAVAIGTIGAAVAFQDVAWEQVAGACALTSIVTFLMCLAGLPETPELSPVQARLAQRNALPPETEPDP